MAAIQQALPLSRRRFVQGAGVAGLGLLAGCAGLPGRTPPATRVPRVGVLNTDYVPHYWEAFRQGLGELGYVDGRNIALDYRSADGHYDRVPELSAELARLPSDVIVTTDSASTTAAKEATSTIPIVMAVSGDPVRQGFVASFARPGGNVTGLSLIAPELSAKRLEVLRDAAPSISRVAVLWNPDNPAKLLEMDELNTAAAALGVRLQSLEVRDREDLPPRLEGATREGADALLVLGEQLTINNRAQIVDFVVQRRLPAVYSTREFVSAGGLMCYGPNVNDSYRRAANYVDRILKGAAPADLPVEQPTTFEFVINLKTAEALGLTIPQHVLLQATEIIQ